MVAIPAYLHLTFDDFQALYNLSKTMKITYSVLAGCVDQLNNAQGDRSWHGKLRLMTGGSGYGLDFVYGSGRLSMASGLTAKECFQYLQGMLQQCHRDRLFARYFGQEG
jgi:hypothetical protein